MERTAPYFVFRIAYSALQYAIRNTQYALLAAAVALFALARSAPAQAQQPTPSDDEVNRVARQLYCPVCENTPLDVCPTQACQQWRDTIREKLAAGWSDQQIKDYFAQQYGDRVLGTPPPRGFNWLLYVLPPLGILLGGYIVYQAMRSWRGEEEGRGKKEEGSTPVAMSVDDEYAARLEAELRKRK